MAVLASLPTLSVQIAFNPTNLQTTTQTWTDVTAYVRDFNTNSGRQHFLDRIEASTVRMTLDNRTGYFLNGTTNGTGSIIRTRLPIKITAATGGSTYPVFYGLIESCEEKTYDMLNQEIILTATDNTKYLSLLYMDRSNFYGNYAQSASAISWYRCDTTTGLNDKIGTNNGQVVGATQNVAGALYYDTNTALDLTNGGINGNLAYLQFPVPAANVWGIDFWVIGNQLTSSTLAYANSTIAGAGVSISVDSQGRVYGQVGPPVVTVTAPNPINDGKWHHVGIYAGALSGSNYPYYLYVDGVSYSIGNVSTGTYLFSTWQIGNPANETNAYIDEVVLSAATSTMSAELAQRFTAGSLLKNTIASGDRIAEILVLAGFGTITSGAIVPSNFTVNDVAWTANSGAFFVQGFQSAVTNSTALDLIQQVTDTDIGAFFQTPTGVFEFDDQAYLYTAANNVTPTGQNIWTDSDGSMVIGYEAPPMSILRDDADVWTTVKITAQNGTVQTYENTAAEPLYGYSTLTKNNVVSVTNEQAMQSAIYLGNLYQSPLPRVQNVDLTNKYLNGAALQQMLGHYLNDPIQFQRNQNGASSAGWINSTMVIESIRHTFTADPGEWDSSFTLDPYPKRNQNASPQSFFMLFDDSTYGKFDSTNAYL